MKIKEVEQRLGIDRANIRYYEREHLLSPARTENRYRDYSEADVARLKTVVILRKLGLSVSEIREILNGQRSLTEALTENEQTLRQQIETLNGALSLCRRMEAQRLELDTFDQDFYWEELHREERKGQLFLDICQDYLSFEKELFSRTFWDMEQTARELGWTGWKAVAGVAAMAAVTSVLLGLLSVLAFHDSFWDGFFTMLDIFLFLSVVFLPEFLLRRKHPRAARLWRRGMNILLVAVGVAFILLAAVMVLNDRLHFLF